MGAHLQSLSDTGDFDSTFHEYQKPVFGSQSSGVDAKNFPVTNNSFSMALSGPSKKNPNNPITLLHCENVPVKVNGRECLLYYKRQPHNMNPDSNPAESPISMTGNNFDEVSLVLRNASDGTILHTRTLAIENGKIKTGTDVQANAAQGIIEQAIKSVEESAIKQRENLLNIRDGKPLTHKQLTTVDAIDINALPKLANVTDIGTGTSPARISAGAEKQGVDISKLS